MLLHSWHGWKAQLRKKERDREVVKIDEKRLPDGFWTLLAFEVFSVGRRALIADLL